MIAQPLFLVKRIQNMNNNLDSNYLDGVRKKLFVAMKELRVSIEAAHERLLETYGKEHEFVVRLESYYSALDKQEEYAHELDDCIKNKNFENLQTLVMRINAISEMIKFDARSLLSMLQTGKDLIPDDIQFH